MTFISGKKCSNTTTSEKHLKGEICSELDRLELLLTQIEHHFVRYRANGNLSATVQ